VNFYEGVGDLKIEDSDSEVLYTNSTALGVYPTNLKNTKSAIKRKVLNNNKVKQNINFT
jgi:hypothetical protein